MKSKKEFVAIGAAGLLVALASAAADVPADLVLRQGTLYPVSAPGAMSGSIAIRGGRIVYVGDDAGVVRFVGPSTETVLLKGRAVTPGLIDAHSHLEGLGEALEQVDLRGVTSYEEVVRSAVAAAAKLPKGSWIGGRGWDQNLWADKAFPHHKALSAAVPDHPVMLERIDGHALLVNAAAMRAVGLSGAQADPPGGRIERDAAGEPSGVLVDTATDLVTNKLPDPSAADRQRRLLRAGEEAAKFGLTTVTDMGVGPESVAAYKKLQKKLPVRAALFWSGSDARIGKWLGEKPWTGDGARIVLRGVKLYADGALGSRGAALIEPYADDPKNLGLVITPGPEMARVVRLARKGGWQVGIHAIGDRGNLLALDAMDEAFGGQARPELRWRIEHVQVIRHQDLARMARLGVIASFQPTHATSDMPWVPARLGRARVNRGYAWRVALDAGARLAFGSDFPVEQVDPLLGLYAAVTRQDLDGKPAGGWLPDQRLTRAEALRGFTLDAAWSLFLDQDVGSIEVGKRADLTVFDRDPMTLPERDIPKARVDLTLVDGRVAYRR